MIGRPRGEDRWIEGLLVGRDPLEGECFANSLAYHHLLDVVGQALTENKAIFGDCPDAETVVVDVEPLAIDGHLAEHALVDADKRREPPRASTDKQKMVVSGRK